MMATRYSVAGGAPVRDREDLDGKVPQVDRAQKVPIPRPGWLRLYSPVLVQQAVIAIADLTTATAAQDAAEPCVVRMIATATPIIDIPNPDKSVRSCLPERLEGCHDCCKQGPDASWNGPITPS